MKSLVNAYFNNELSTQRGTHCAVGTVLFDLLGIRIGYESWGPILASFRFKTMVPEGLKGLQDMIEDVIDLDLLNTIDYAYSIDEDVDSKLRRVVKATEQIQEPELV